MVSFLKAQREDNKAKHKELYEKYEGSRKLMFADPALNWCTGGLARGRCNLVYGPRGSGKTALALIAAGIEQRTILNILDKRGLSRFTQRKNSEGKMVDDKENPRGWVVIFDSEGYVTDHGETDETGQPTEAARLAAARLARAGLDPSLVMVAGDGNRVENVFKNLKALGETLEYDKYIIASIVVDSWGGLQDKKTIGKIEGKDMDKVADNYGGNARTIGGYVQYLLDIALRYGVTNIWVQHCIQNLKSDFPKWVLIGGQKLQFEVHSVLFVESAEGKDSHLLDGDVASKEHSDVKSHRVGKKIYAQCIKSRFITEGRKAEFYMNFSTLQFALPEFSLLNLAKKLGLIKTAGAWHSFPKDVPNPAKFQGDSGFIKGLSEDKDLYNKMIADCWDASGTDATGGITFGSDEGIQGDLTGKLKEAKK